MVTGAFVRKMECHSLTCSLLCSNTAASLGRILLQAIVYAAPNTFAPIRSATAYGIPNKPDAIDNAPNVLNAVCHAYPAEYPTPIPPIIPMYGYIDSGSSKYRIANNRHPTILNAALLPARSLQSSGNGRQTDMLAIPAHIALGSPSNDMNNIALETTNERRMYHLFLAELILNSRNKSRNDLLYGLFF